MNEILRYIKLLLDPKAAQDLQKDSQQALDKGTDPKRPKKNLTAVEKAMDRVKKAAVALGASILAAFSVRAISQFMRSSIDASVELERSRNMLAMAFRNEGIEIATVNNELDAFRRGLWETHRLTEGEINPVLQQLITITGDYETSLRGVGIAADLAAATGMDATSAARLLGRVIKGDTAALRRYGITIADGADALEVLEDRLAGMAKAATPATESLGKAFGDLKEEIGFALREATDFDARVEQLTGVITRLIARKDDFVRIIRELIRALRDLATTVAVLAGVRGFLALRAAATAAGGGINFLIARLRALQLAMGPVGWLTLAISGIIIMFNRMRDAARDAARAAEEAVARRQAAMVSEEAEEVRRALIEAQQALDRSRKIATEMTANRRRMTDSFRQQLRDEAATVEALSARYTELVMRRDLALAPDAPAREPGEPGAPRARVGERDIGPLAGLMTPEAIAARRQQIREEFTVVEGMAATSMGVIARMVEEARERQAEAYAQMRADAQETAYAMTDAFRGFFEALATGFSASTTHAEAMRVAVTGIGAAMLEELVRGRAEYHTAAAAGALAAGTWPPNPAAMLAASRHMIAAGLFRALPGIVRGMGRSGGGSSAAARPATTIPSSRIEPQRPEINVYIDPLNPSNPAWQSNLAATMQGVRQRYGDAKVNIRPRTA